MSSRGPQSRGKTATPLTPGALAKRYGPDTSIRAPLREKLPALAKVQALREEAQLIVGSKPLEYYGRNPDGTSKRLAAKNFILTVPVEGITESQLDALLTSIGVPPMAGGGRQRGGDLREKLLIAKAYTMMLAYNAGQLGIDSVDYFKNEVLMPIAGTSARVGQIIMKLADQVIVKAPTTVVVLGLSTLGASANVLATIVKKFNAWGRNNAAILLTDEFAENAAAVAVGDAKAIASTAGVALGVANMAGVLPLSTLAAAILYGLKVTITNKNIKAHIVAGLYTWYLSQPEQTRIAIQQGAINYARTAKDAAANGAVKVKDTAVTLAPLLLATGAAAGAVALAAPGAVAAAPAAAAAAVQAAVAAVQPLATQASALLGGIQVQGRTAFQVIASLLPAAGVAAAAVPPEDAAGAAAILEEGAPAAAIAVGAYGPEIEAAIAAADAAAAAAVAAADAGVAAAGMGVAAAGDDRMGAPAGGRRHRKTKKRAMRKRRMTRRRPIFSY